MHILKGHYRQEGGQLSQGTLLVDAMAGGRFREAESGAPLEARKYEAAKGTIMVEITSPEAAWEFIPDGGECERIGMPIGEPQ